MSNAVSNRAQLSLIKESAFGSTLSSTTLKRLRLTGENVQHNPMRAHSGQIEPDRNRVEVMDLGFAAAGNIDAELSYTDFESVLRSVLCAGAGLADTPTTGITRYLNGTTIDSYYAESLFNDVAVIKGIYGMVFNDLTITFEANKEIALQFGVLAQKAIKVSPTRSTAITAPSTDAVMRSGADVAYIKLGGSVIAAAVQKLTLNIRNNFAPRGEIGQGGPQEMLAHSFEVSGSMTTYFPSAALYDDMVAATVRALEVKASNAAGAIGFQLPAITLNGGTPPIPGQNQDVLLEIPFLAAKGTLGGNACTMAIDFDPAG